MLNNKITLEPATSNGADGSSSQSARLTSVDSGGEPDAPPTTSQPKAKRRRGAKRKRPTGAERRARNQEHAGDIEVDWDGDDE